MKSAVLVITAASLGGAFGATSYTSTSATSAWNASRWNNSADGPSYSAGYTANNDVSFTSGTYSFAGMGATTNVGNITLSNNVTVNFASVGSTFATNGSVRSIDVGTGALMDFSTQSFSTAAGTGFIKNGAGVLALAGNTFTGGFTVNAGTVILRGVNAMGAGGALTLNGGTVAGSATRNLSGKYTNVTIGGNMQFGEVAANVAAASDSANLTFDSTMALGASARTLTLGNAGTVTFGGVISNTATNGLTFAATTGGSGRFELTNTTNTFTGPISITGGEVRFAANGSLGNAANTVTVDGGRLGIVNAAGTVDLSSRSIYLGSTAGTSISAPGALTTILKYDGVLQDKTGSNGILVKQGQGILSLGGVSTYTGDTSINNGNIQLTTGNNRLPTGTVVNIGQSASANLGTLDLNGLNQQIAGLNSTSGTNATTGKNTVTSAAVATLTIGGAGSYSYGDGTNANSGVITGAISLVKQGNGIQTLGDANTYTGNTNVAAGTLVINGNQSAATGYVTLANGATLMGTGTVGGATTINGTHAPTAQASGSSQTFSSTLNYAPNSTFEWNLNAAPDDPGANASNLGTYGQVAAAGTVSGTSAFKVVLGANSFTDAFWDTNKSWNNIFTGAGVTTGTLHSLFATFDTTTGVDSTGHVAGQGYFTFTPTGNTLTWTAAVPEPTTGALVGLLAGAGLLRRRRAGV